MYTDGKRYVDNSYRFYWDKYFRIYKRQRVDRHYEGISDPVIPEVFTIVENLVATIAGGDIKFHFTRTNEEQTNEVDALNGLLEYWLKCNKMNLRAQEWVREMLMYGTGILHITWVDDKPCIDNIPLRDFFFSPQATNMENCTYAGFVYLGDLNKMKEMKVYDDASDSMVPKYTGLDDIGPATPADAKTMDKQFKDQFNGSTFPLDEAATRQVFVALIYDLNSGKIIEIANDKQIIRQAPIPYQREEQTKMEPVINPANGQELEAERKLDAIKPFIPIAVLRDYIDTSLFLGEGEIAVIADRGEDLNDLEAMDTDNLAYQNTPMYQIDPQFSDLAPEIETIPGAVYPIPKGAIGSLPIAEIAQNLDEKKDRIIAQMEKATAADEAMAPPANAPRVTATEVVDNTTTSQNRFSTKINNMESEGYAQLGNILYKMAQIFITEKTAVRIDGPQGAYFKDFDPWDFNGEWEPGVQLKTTQDKQLLQMGQKDNQIYQILSQDPDGIFNPVEIKRWEIQHIDPSMSDEDFNKLLAPPVQKGPTDEEQRIAENLKKAEYQAISYIYQYATPFVQAQIETILNMQPDPMHEEEENTNAMEHGAKQADLLNPATDATGKPDASVVNSAPGIQAAQAKRMQPVVPPQPGAPDTANQPPVPTPAGAPAQ